MDLWPTYELTATGAEQSDLISLCDAMVLDGVSCDLRHVWEEGLVDIAPDAAWPTAQQQRGQVRTAELDLTEEEAHEAEPVALYKGGPRRTYRLSTADTFADRREVRIVAVGDVMMGSDFPHRGGLHPRLRNENVSVEDVLDPALVGLIRSADIGFLNLEGVLLDGGKTAKACKKCFAFRSPEFYAQLLAEAGFTTASVANNHSGDFGRAGRNATIEALSRAGIMATGLPRDDARVASQTAANGLRIATVAFATSKGTLSLHDPDAAEMLVTELDATHDIVIVSVHAGAEGPRASRVRRGREIYLNEDRGDIHGFPTGCWKPAQM